MQFTRLTWLALCLAAAALLSPEAALAQPDGSSPVYRIQEGTNEVSLIELFGLFIEHDARIRRIMDFDEQVISIQTVEGNPNQFRVYALKSGVTTITIVDEHDRSYTVEVLVRGDVRHLESFIRRQYPNDSISIEEVSDECVRLNGWVSKPEYVSEIQSIAEQFYPQVLNHMKTGGVQQVLLKCTILEVQRSKLRRLGMNLSLIKPDGYVITTPGPIVPITNLAAQTTGAAATFSNFSTTSVNFGLTRPNGVFQGFIQAMIDENILKSHAQPMIIAHNGRAANLLSGGEVPIPTAAGLGATGVEYREFGIQMNAVPYILGNGRVRLEVETIVRDKDLANSVSIQGNLTPGFKTNSANTQVEMNFGEALVIAGLVARREIGIGQKLPFVGELPWIGAAFSRKSYEESETELIILVTPELVAAMPANQLPSKGPGQFTDMPVDRELFAHGLFEVPYFGDPCETCPDCTAFGHCSRYPECQHCEDGVGGYLPGNGGSCAPVSSSRAAPSAQSGEIRPVSRPRVPNPPATDSRTGRSESGNAPGRSRSAGTGSSGLISPTMR